MTRDEYRRRARECIALAGEMKDPDNRIKLLGMAQAWLKLADYSFMFEDAGQMVNAATQAETPKE